VSDTQPFGWNGSVPDLETQVQQSVRTTMRGRALTTEQTADLVAFLKSLSPPPVLEVVDASAVARGRDVFAQRRCTRCHQSPAYTCHEIVDVGLQDELGRSKFNPPSLRGVGQRRALFHDGSCRSMEEVVDRARHQLDEELSDEERADVLAFLRSL
jgi:cytochrome c peroxidase